MGEILLFFPPTLLSVNEMEIQEVHKLVTVKSQNSKPGLCDYKAMHLTAILCCEKNMANLKIVLIMSNLATPRPQLIYSFNMNMPGVVGTGGII